MLADAAKDGFLMKCAWCDDEIELLLGRCVNGRPVHYTDLSGSVICRAEISVTVSQMTEEELLEWLF